MEALLKVAHQADNTFHMGKDMEPEQALKRLLDDDPPVPSSLQAAKLPLVHVFTILTRQRPVVVTQ